MTKRNIPTVIIGEDVQFDTDVKCQNISKSSVIIEFVKIVIYIIIMVCFSLYIYAIFNETTYRLISVAIILAVDILIIRKIFMNYKNTIICMKYKDNNIVVFISRIKEMEIDIREIKRIDYHYRGRQPFTITTINGSYELRVISIQDFYEIIKRILKRSNVENAVYLFHTSFSNFIDKYIIRNEHDID